MPKGEMGPSLAADLSLARAIREMRKAKGMTQAALAHRTGRAQTHISGIEKGTFDFRVSTLTAIAAALECEVILVPRHADRTALGGLNPTGGQIQRETLLDEVFVPNPSSETKDDR